ncbi:MAG: hypothetical protein JWO36_2 [Myxococcales bacterium]|nr:hypothetical protein [Myxococcales bacterium]
MSAGMLKRGVLLACSLAGCINPDAPQQRLADLTGATVSVKAKVDPTGNTLTIDLIASDCFSITDDVTAEVNSKAATITSRGTIENSYVDESTSCKWPSFTVENAPALPGLISSLQIKDANTTFRMEVRDLLTNDLAPASAMVPGRPLILMWPSATTIKGAFATFYDGRGSPMLSSNDGGWRVTGHELELDVPAKLQGTGVLKVGAWREPPVMTCEGGIAKCSVVLTVNPEFTLTIQNP